MQDRVIFLKKAAQLMQTKGRIKLNTKRLYQADGYAVKELIKIAQVLYSAIKSNPEEDDDVLGSDNFSVKLDDLQNVRKFASDITAHGVLLGGVGLGRGLGGGEHDAGVRTWVDGQLARTGWHAG